MNIKLFRVLVPVLVIVSMFVLVGSALATTPPPGACGSDYIIVNGLKVGKDINCSWARNWLWGIVKDVDESSLTLSPGQSHVVNYTVIASALSSTQYTVDGRIGAKNMSAAPITLTGVSDSLGPVVCPAAFPVVLDPQEEFICTYTTAPSASQPTQNVGTFTRSGGESVSVTVPINWAGATTSETNECALVTDTFAGNLGNVCAGTTTHFTFTYPREIGPYSDCGTYTVNNTATVTPGEGGASSSDGATVGVTVPCAGGCTLTPGYWKTHAVYGPARYDNTWDAFAGGNAEFLDTGKSYYQVLWTDPSGGNAYIILAHAYIAAKLNMLNGASVPANVQSAFDQATTLLTSYQYTMSIPRGSNRTLAISLATILDNYNNGLIGPGHCSE